MESLKGSSMEIIKKEKKKKKTDNDNNLLTYLSSIPKARHESS